MICIGIVWIRRIWMRPAKYSHVVFKAHDDERCTGKHDDVKPWPDGCLLDPYRIPWKTLEQVKFQNPRHLSTDISAGGGY